MPEASVWGKGESGQGIGVGGEWVWKFEFEAALKSFHSRFVVEFGIRGARAIPGIMIRQ